MNNDSLWRDDLIPSDTEISVQVNWKKNGLMKLTLSESLYS